MRIQHSLILELKILKQTVPDSLINLQMTYQGRLRK